MRRVVILHHTFRNGEHWDLMLEQADVLLTWQLPVNPLSDPAATGHADWPLPAIRIGDHRLAYLSYEGEISGGRGSVRRAGVGSYTPVSSFTPGDSTSTTQPPEAGGAQRAFDLQLENRQLRLSQDSTGAWWLEHSA